MNQNFPGAIPELPVHDLTKATKYYTASFGFTLDWIEGSLGMAGISKGNCRMFLTNDSFRQRYRNVAPVMVWLNLSSKEQVNELHEIWSGNQARIVSPPESKSWGLHEFTAADLDGNLFRVFYDFATPEREDNC